MAANLLDRQFDAADRISVGRGHDRVCGSSGKLYLAVVLDLFSRFAVGWAVSAVNDRHLTIKALEMALKRRCPEIGLLHHSDQGCTYASADYQALLDARGIVCSMSNCHDNADGELLLHREVSSPIGFGDQRWSCSTTEVFYNPAPALDAWPDQSSGILNDAQTVDPMENRPRPAPHPLSFSMRKEQTPRNDQLNETVH